MKIFVCLFNMCVWKDPHAFKKMVWRSEDSGRNECPPTMWVSSEEHARLGLKHFTHCSMLHKIYFNFSVCMCLGMSHVVYSHT